MSSPECKRQLDHWTSTALGQALISDEQARLEPLLGRLYGPIAIQLGVMGFSSFIQSSGAVHQIFAVDYPVPDDPAPLRPSLTSAAEAMPFGAKSASVILLPHVLEFSDDPHQVLREAERVLVPEGHLVLVGFNPFSFWGVRRALAPLLGRGIPWNVRFYSLSRVKEWLSVLGFEIVSGSAACYLPPVKSVKIRRKLAFMQKAGERWCPMCAAVFILVARKREVGMTPITLRWRRERSLAPGLVKPVARHG